MIEYIEVWKIIYGWSLVAMQSLIYGLGFMVLIKVSFKDFVIPIMDLCVDFIFRIKERIKK